jgi:hypothetical protein
MHYLSFKLGRFEKIIYQGAIAFGRLELDRLEQVLQLVVVLRGIG